MNTLSASNIDPMALVRELSSLPHRGATTDMEKKAAGILEQTLRQAGADVEIQSFITPKTYITEVWWIVGAICFGLAMAPFIPWPALALVTLAVGLAWLNFDWHHTPLKWLPPRAVSQNVIGRFPDLSDVNQEAPNTNKKRIILMGHYDSAPVSFLYKPSLVKNFRKSLIVNLFIMGLTPLAVLFVAFNVARPVALGLSWILIAYFLVQGVIAGLDFLRYGYTNGASDNATGTAVALTLGQRLQNTIPGWDVEVVLTGAEEAGMVGARHYLTDHHKSLTSQPTYILNFDNIGQGDLKYITKTGSVTNVIYDNLLVEAARTAADEIPHFKQVTSAAWHTGDFDSLWFNRAGIPSLTLSAQDTDGLIPDLHRPTDTLENVDPHLLGFSLDYAEALVRKLAEKARI